MKIVIGIFAHDAGKTTWRKVYCTKQEHKKAGRVDHKMHFLIHLTWRRKENYYIF